METLKKRIINKIIHRHTHYTTTRKQKYCCATHTHTHTQTQRTRWNGDDKFKVEYQINKNKNKYEKKKKMKPTVRYYENTIFTLTHHTYTGHINTQDTQTPHTWMRRNYIKMIRIYENIWI